MASETIDTRLSFESRDIEAAIRNRFQHSMYPELRHVHCRWQFGTATLVGNVSSYYMKQRAQAELLGLPSVEFINNQLEVCPRA